MQFKLHAPFQPMGDQPEAIRGLVDGVRAGKQHQVLLGATGTGKTFTIASVIQELQKPALVMAHNKTLAAQLYAEFKEFFPKNAVEYFVSYYDYYQPEAYVPATDTYIEKDSSINEEVERLRHSATNSLLTRRDVIVVSTVSCIYGLGTPQEYVDRMVRLKVGDEHDRDSILRRLVEIQYTRNDMAFTRGTFRVRGDTLEIFPVYEELAVRVEFFGDEIERLMTLPLAKLDLKGGPKKASVPSIPSKPPPTPVDDAARTGPRTERPSALMRAIEEAEIDGRLDLLGDEVRRGVLVARDARQQVEVQVALHVVRVLDRVLHQIPQEHVATAQD